MWAKSDLLQLKNQESRKNAQGVLLWSCEGDLCWDREETDLSMPGIITITQSPTSYIIRFMQDCFICNLFTGC